MSLRRLVFVGLVAFAALGIVVASALMSRSAHTGEEVGGTVAARFTELTRDAVWMREEVVPIAFDTYHPQGFARDGEHLFLSAVEVIDPPERFETPRDGADRTPGRGRGHLFKMTMDGELVADLELGEGTMYHPGGIDAHDGTVWIPVAEYRSHSRSVVYRVDARTMEAEEALRFDDHLGAVVFDPVDRRLYAANWGARTFYTWELDENLDVFPNVSSEPARHDNPAHYVDYQDCQIGGGGRALCAGVSRITGDQGSAVLGGVELVNLRDGRPLHQVPVPLWTESGLPMTQNPVHAEAVEDGLRFYFLPEDNPSRLFVYHVAPASASAPAP